MTSARNELRVDDLCLGRTNQQFRTVPITTQLTIIRAADMANGRDGQQRTFVDAELSRTAKPRRLDLLGFDREMRIGKSNGVVVLGLYFWGQLSKWAECPFKGLVELFNI